MSDSPTAMLCPSCRVPLVMSERQSVEIDYCPQCRGVWLDRGELDKIIERNSQETPTAAAGSTANYRQPPYRGDDHRGHDQTRHGHGRRKKSFLEDLFD